jgi:phosphomethylpyrimidine synthase
VAVSDALTPAQQEILAQRGVLPPEEIHRLASKTKHAGGAAQGKKASCHSDLTEAAVAKRLQSDRLVELRVPSHGSEAE